MPLNTFVGPTPVAVYVPTVTSGDPSVVLVNAGTTTLYLGGNSGVTQNNGLPLPANSRISYALAPLNVYAVCGSANSATTNTLSAAAASGATTVTLTSATGFTTGASIAIGAGAARETVKITNVATNTLTVSPAISYDHASGAAVAVLAPATASLGGGTIEAFAGVV